MSLILGVNRDPGVGSSAHNSYGYGYPFQIGSRNEYPSGHNIDMGYQSYVSINHSIQNTHSHHPNSNDNHDDHDNNDSTDTDNMSYTWADQPRPHNLQPFLFAQENSEVLTSVLPSESLPDMSNSNSLDGQTDSQIHSRENIFPLLGNTLHSNSTIFYDSPIMVEHMNSGNHTTSVRDGYYHSESYRESLFYPSTFSLEYQDQSAQQPISTNQPPQEYVPQEPVPHQSDSVNSSTPSPVYEFEIYNLDVPPPDPVRQRRVGRACQNCHYDKKKCSAPWPCERCVVENLDCTPRS